MLVIDKLPEHKRIYYRRQVMRWGYKVANAWADAQALWFWID